MKLILNEIHKLFIKRHFIILLVLLLLIEILSFCVSLDKRIELDEDSAEVYINYMKEYGGQLTEERIKLIDAAIEERYKNEELVEKLNNEFLNKEISTDQYRDNLSAIKDKVKGATGFNRFIDEYYAALENDSVLSDSTIWNELFDDGIDFVMVITIIFMIISLTVYDEEIGINSLKISTKNGKAKMIETDLFISSLLSVLIPAFVFFIKPIIAKSFFGLDGYDNLISTAKLFEFSPWQLSLLSSYIYICIIRTLGYLYLGMMTLLIGQILKSSLYTIFLSLVIVYIPGYILSSVWHRYLIPMPSSLLSAVGYFSTVEISNVSMTDDGNIVVNSFSVNELNIFFMVTIFVIISMIVANYLLWTRRRTFK